MALAGPSLLLALLVMGAAPEVEEAANTTPRHHLIDMVVAQVDATVITLSDLVAETRLVLLRTGGAEVARAGHLSQGLLNAVLKSIVSRELLLSEVRRLKLRDVPDPEVQKALDAVRGQFAVSADYERFLDKSGFREPGAEMMRGFNAPPALVAILLAELQVDRFLDVRVRNKSAVRESEIVLCYEVNRAKFDDRSLNEVHDQIRARLEEQKQASALESLLKRLERRATLRYATSFEPPPLDSEEDAIGLNCPEPAAEKSSRRRP